jgi:hypothetical protein
MIRNLGLKKKMALATSLVLAGATISTAAFAVPPGWAQRDPVCDQYMANACITTWQSLGYGNYAHCVAHRQCTECPPWWGYMCGIGPNATEPDEGTKPW